MKVAAELLNELHDFGERRELPKRYSLLEEGEISNHTYFIETGCVRLWYNSDGTDISVKFFLPGEVCASLESFYHEIPSKYELETITPCVLRAVTKSELVKMAVETPKFDDFMNASLVHCMSDFLDLFVDRIGKPPEERYRSLIEQDPKVLDIVPLHYVASYLGITSVSLSRIRKKVHSH